MMLIAAFALALLASKVSAFASDPSYTCDLVYDCTSQPEWPTRFLTVERVYNTTKTASEIWAHIGDHQAFIGANNQAVTVVQPGRYEYNGAGSIRVTADPTTGFVYEELITSYRPESHYTYVISAVCDTPSPAVAAGFRSCGIRLGMEMLSEGAQVKLVMSGNASQATEESLDLVSVLFTQLYVDLFESSAPYIE